MKFKKFVIIYSFLWKKRIDLSINHELVNSKNGSFLLAPPVVYSRLAPPKIWGGRGVVKLSGGRYIAEKIRKNTCTNFWLSFKPSRGANNHPITNLVCPRHHFLAPRESGQKVMPKSWHVAKFFWIRKFHSNFFEKLGLTWESTCKCYPNLGQDLSDL